MSNSSSISNSGSQKVPYGTPKLVVLGSVQQFVRADKNQDADAGGDSFDAGQNS